MIARLEAAIAKNDKFEAEDLLVEVERLIPTDSRIEGLRANVSALPGPNKRISVDLGGGVKMDLALIRPGSFMMGSAVGEDGRWPDERQHKVVLTHAYYLGVTEVTQSQWKALMGTNPSQFEGDDLPVERVSWSDAVAFCETLSRRCGAECRLPTEAEWECACRAGTTGARYGPLEEIAWFKANAKGETHPVGRRRPNAHGLFDMFGNVCEWCADWYGEYPAGEVQDPAGAESGSDRVLRGGSWGADPKHCRSASRGRLYPTSRISNFGLRVAMTP